MTKKIFYWTMCLVFLAIGISSALAPDTAYLFMRVYWRHIGSVFLLAVAGWSQIGYQNLKAAALLVVGASLLAYLPDF